MDLAEKFGLLFKDKKKQYQLGPNLDFFLPPVTYKASTPPTRSNQRVSTGEHFVGIKPRNLLRGNALFKVKIENGQSYLYLTRYVDWHFQNLNAMFNTHVGAVKQTVMVYCDAVECKIVGAQKHSLSRKVELERKGEGRATIEPLHREWIRVRNQHIESIEVSLATPQGNFVGVTTRQNTDHAGVSTSIKGCLSVWPTHKNNHHVGRFTHTVSYPYVDRKRVYPRVG